MKKGEISNKLQAIEREIHNRFGNANLLRYNTGDKVHNKQLEFHKNMHKNRWVFGGNRSGKTECGAVEAIYMARGNHPYRKNRKKVVGWVVSVSRQVQREVAQSKILSYLNPDWIVDIAMCEGRKDGYENGVIDYIIIKF